MERIIIGIDPGTNILGYGVIRVNGKKLELLAMDVLNLQKVEDPFQKLKHIYASTARLIETFKATEMAIEAPFFGKNVQSMLKLGRAQGVAIAAGVSNGLDVFEYSPKKIKLAITGKGTASKEQVAAMLQHLLVIPEKVKYLDATDGLAAAVCHYFQNKISGETEKSYSGWASFINNNPNRVK